MFRKVSVILVRRAPGSLLRARLSAGEHVTQAARAHTSSMPDGVLITLGRRVFLFRSIALSCPDKHKEIWLICLLSLSLSCGTFGIKERKSELTENACGCGCDGRRGLRCSLFIAGIGLSSGQRWVCCSALKLCKLQWMYRHQQQHDEQF